LEPATHEVSPDDKPIFFSKGGSRYIERTLFLHIHGSDESLEVELDEDSELVLGRYDNITGIVPGVDLVKYEAKEKGVSRKHAALIYKDGLLKVSDLDSANFTYLNGQKLVPNQPRIVRDGDKLTLGTLYLTVQFGEHVQET
jgi:pSer/pThr/pTyr-binding forkhead associated (FHA) protein